MVWKDRISFGILRSSKNCLIIFTDESNESIMLLGQTSKINQWIDILSAS
jgi:hypothetical protein